MKILFIIPARRGSKRLPGKNKKLFNGKPLISHTIDFALSVSDKSDNICITTDDEEILALARYHSVSLIINRPVVLASDSATSVDVILHAIETAMNKNLVFDTIVLLQPTTPFRSPSDFREMKAEFKKKNMNLYASISSFQAEEKNSILYDKNSFRASNSREGITGYLNGSIYMFSAKYLTDNSFLNFDDCYFYVMSDKNSIDIDTIEDWVLAEKFI